MSWQAQTAVNHHSKQETMSLLRLLLYLAEKADSTGAVDPAPSQTTLAGFFDCTERTIRNRIGQLYDSGELKQTRVGSGPGTASAYLICLPMPENTGNDDTKGGKMAEINPASLSALAEQMAELKAEILELKVEINLLKAEKVETKGGKAARSKVQTNHYDPTLNQEEEDSTPPTPLHGNRKPDYPQFEMPAALAFPDFEDAWIAWYKHTAELDRPLTQTSGDVTLKRIAKWGKERAIAAIYHSIDRRWKSIHEPDDARPSTNGHHTNDIEAMKARVAAKLQEERNARQLAQ